MTGILKITISIIIVFSLAASAEENCSELLDLLNTEDTDPAGIEEISSKLLDSSCDEVKNNRSKILFFRAQVRLALKKYEPAINDLNIVLNGNLKLSEKLSVLELRSMAYHGSGQTKLALADMKKSVQWGTSNLDIYAALYNQYAIEEKNVKKAAQLLDTCVANQPNKEKAYLFKARIHFDEKKYDLALDDYKNATKIAPGNVDAWSGIFRILKKKDQLDKLLSALHLSIQRSRNTGILYYYRAYTYNYLWGKQGELESNISSYVKKYDESLLDDINIAITLLKLSPSKTTEELYKNLKIEMLLRLAAKYKALNNLTQMEKYYNQIVLINPEWQKVIKNNKSNETCLRYLEQGLLSLSKNKNSS